MHRHTVVTYLSILSSSFLVFVGTSFSIPTPTPNSLTRVNVSTKNDEFGTQHSTATRLRTMYPLPRLINNGTVKVDSIHEIYYEEYGNERDHDDGGQSNANAKRNRQTTALNLHGGPGAGSFPNHSRFFNSTLYSRIILFDQRGCGRSTPRGEIRNNTLEHLIMDIEKLRMHLNIDKWDIILGGSWGSTLALAYAQRYPERVGGLVLRGICLFRNKEIEWLFGDRSSTYTAENKGQGEPLLTCVGDSDKVFEQWSKFKNAVNVGDEEEATRNGEIDSIHFRRETLQKYYDYLLGDNAWDRIIAAKNWMLWEMTVSKLSGNAEVGEGAHLFIGTSNNGWLLKQIGEDGEEIAREKTFEPCAFRQWSRHGHGHERQFQSSNYVSFEPKLVRSQTHLPNNDRTQLRNMTDEDVQKFIPAQAMLTCFYSVNNEFIMSKFDLLSKENIDRIKHIPCVAIQGGQDSICPPDSALDLKEAWPGMELRIVISGRHSQYDPQITSELVKATDKIAVLRQTK